MNLTPTSFGLPLVSGPVLLLTVGAFLAALGVANFRANRSAVVTLRTSKSLELAREAAGYLRVSVEDLAPLLGLGSAETALWVIDGVPRRHQRAVADLHRATVALTQRFPAPVARRLLVVRVERSAAIKDARRQLSDLSRASRQGHISVTLR